MSPRCSAGSVKVAACAALCAAVALAALAGCQNTRAGSEGDSVIAPLLPMTPREAAIDAANMDDPDKRAHGLALLSAAPFGGEEPYVVVYREYSNDPDSTVRAVAVAALGRHGTVNDAEIMIVRLNDQSPHVRAEAARALQKVHQPTAVKPLIVALSDESADVRHAAAYALGQYAQPAVFDALVGALDDVEYGVVRAAQQSLETLTGQSFGEEAQLWIIFAQRNPGKLFENRRQYVYHVYKEPPSMLGWLTSWNRPAEPVNTARIPRGMVAGEAESNQPGS